jgi:hypothetical protein
MIAPGGINFDWIEPGRKIRIRIDQDQARLLGLSSGVDRGGDEQGQ